MGNIEAQIDYGNLINIPASDYVSAIETRFADWSGSPATTIDTDLVALTPSQQQWVMFGLDLLVDNTTAAHLRLDRVDAVKRLVARAPSATSRPLGVKGFEFEREVLEISGWLQVALAASLSGPSVKDYEKIKNSTPLPPDRVLHAPEHWMLLGWKKSWCPR